VNQTNPSTAHDPVVIVGAGLAGLTCAKVLASAGRSFVLLEAAPEPGGRVVSLVRTDGFTLDRGFQVLLDSYPTARRHLDLAALGGGRFRAGAMFVGEGAPRFLENPLWNPVAVIEALRGRVISRPDLLRLALLAVSSCLAREGSLQQLSGAQADVSAELLLRSHGLGDRFFARFARPFFGGVLLDPQLRTSGALLQQYLRRFATGRALLPGAGIAAIPAQLAAGLPQGALRLSSPVRALRWCGDAVPAVVLADGEEITAGALVLAVDEPSACRLLGRGEPREARSTAVHYFAAPQAWYEGGWLCLPPRDGRQPVLHAAILTNVSPTLAPPGRHLWSVTVGAREPGADDPDLVARVVAGWFGAAAAELKHLDFVRVPYAVPAQPPGFAARPAPWGPLPRGVQVVGDAVSGASIEAAMSGGEASAKILISSAPPA
jgi:phytoene dehydrogenase-like protein